MDNSSSDFMILGPDGEPTEPDLATLTALFQPYTTLLARPAASLAGLSGCHSSAIR